MSPYYPNYVSIWFDMFNYSWYVHITKFPKLESLFLISLIPYGPQAVSLRAF